MTSAHPPPFTLGFSQLLTSSGPAAIAVIRFGGDAATGFLARHIHFATAATAQSAVGGAALHRAALVDSDGTPLDDVLLSRHHDTAGEQWRIHLHGSPWIVRRCTELLAASGLPTLTISGPPIWPCVDQLEAEADLCLGHMLTAAGARWLLDNVVRLRAALRALLRTDDPDYGRTVVRNMLAAPDMLSWHTSPLRVAVVGPPNAGKSTLINALAGRNVSIVSPTPGTTRDWVEARADAGGFPFSWLDTAGVRAAADSLEAAGIEQTRRVTERADAVLIVLDGTGAHRGETQTFVRANQHIHPAAVALNKSDLGPASAEVRSQLPAEWGAAAVEISAAHSRGLDALLTQVCQSTQRCPGSLPEPRPFTARQRAILTAAAASSDHKSFQDNILTAIG